MAGTTRPELEMIRRAVAPGVVVTAAAFAVGTFLAGPGPGASAALGVVVVVANFAAHGWSLAWAARISITLVQAVALGGFVVRMAVIVGLLFGLNALPWFSPVAFALSVVPGTIALLAFEARLALGGLGGALQIPPDPAAVRAAEALAARDR